MPGCEKTFADLLRVSEERCKRRKVPGTQNNTGPERGLSLLRQAVRKAGRAGGQQVGRCGLVLRLLRGEGEPPRGPAECLPGGGGKRWTRLTPTRRARH